MLLGTYPVRIDEPAETLGRLMSEIRDWLDNKQIVPAEFKTIAARGWQGRPRYSV
jgi:hypothetical protein